MEYYQPAIPAIHLDELVRRVRWYIKLRWFYIGSLSLISSVTLMVVQGYTSDAQRIVLIGASALFYNGVLALLALIPWRRLTYFRVLAFLAIFFDISLATYLIRVFGGVESRSIILYAIPIIVSGVLLGRFALYFAASLCAFLYGLTLVLLQEGRIPVGSFGLAALPNSPAYVGYSIAFYTAVFFVLAFVSDFLIGLNRQREQTKASTQLVALASHELRTPATAVSGLIEMVQNEAKQLSPVSRHYLDQAYLENNRELALIENLLAIAKLDSGDYEKPTAMVDLSRLVTRQTDRLQPFFEANDQIIHTQIEGGVSVVADEDLLGLAIYNLLSNANRFAPPKSEINVRLEQSESLASLHVIDQGPGISKADHERIFDRFTKISRQFSGAGLGLYLARRIAEIHKGKLAVSSEPGNGSDFALQLPSKREN